jgi:hypothetical protein
MTRAAAHLNDANQLVYTSTVLLPFFNMAVDELEGELGIYDLTPMKRESLVINVPANSNSLPSLPIDFVEAVELLERNAGSTDDWLTVNEVKDINPNNRTSDNINEWTIRGSSIFINPPTIARDTYLRYIAGLQQATGTGTVIDVESSRAFLALVTARNTARDLGNAPTKADSYSGAIALAKDRLIRRLQLNTQTVSGVRRLPYRGRR